MLWLRQRGADQKKNDLQKKRYAAPVVGREREAGVGGLITPSKKKVDMMGGGEKGPAGAWREKGLAQRRDSPPPQSP